MPQAGAPHSRLVEAPAGKDGQLSLDVLSMTLGQRQAAKLGSEMDS
jgi:hypothetical protein